MREMKDSGVEWIGEIPTRWFANKIIRCFEIIGSGTTPKSADDSQYAGDINWIQSGDINGGILSNTRFRITQEVVAATSALKVYKAPFIVIAMYGASIGNLSISQIDACTNQACCVLSRPAEGLDFEYLFYAFKPAKDYLIWKADGGGQPNISQDKVKGLWIPIPPIDEQIRIVDYLNLRCGQVDELVANVQAQIEKLKAYKQSLITETVTKGLDPAVPMKDSGVEWVGSIPAHWDVIKTGRLFKENNRKPFGNDTPLSLSQLDGLIATDDMKESALKTSTYENWKRVELGDLILNRFKAHLGVLFAATLTGIVSFHYGVYEARRPLVPKYYEYLYHSEQYRAILGNASNGMVVGLQNLSNLNFYSTYSLCPDYEEQEAIVAYLDEKCSQIDRLIAIKQAKIAKLEQYKRSLIYEYVTGKKEVPAHT